MNVPLSDCIAPDFRQVHHHIKQEKYTEYWFRGGRGSTKSSFVSIEIVLQILQDTEANVVVFRRYENEIRDSVYGQLKWAIGKLGLEHLFKFQVSPFKMIYTPTGQQIIFKGADNPQKIKSINLGKGYIKFGWFEECDQFGGMEEMRNILQSLFRGTTKKQIAFFSYNPPKSARSWVNAETRVEKSGRFVHYSDYRTVPPDWLGTTFLTNAEHLRKSNFDAYRHEYLGEEIGTGLEVFSNVTLRTIPEGEIQYFDNYYQGLDFGYAADPLAFTQSHFDPKRRILYIFFEIVEQGLKNSVFAEKLDVDQKANITMADGAEPKSIAELKEDWGLNVSGAKKGPGSVEHGIKWLQDLEEIVIDPERCPHAAKEFMNYALEVSKDGEVISKYPDKDNHCFAGETLISTLTGPKRIDEIQVGELVLTRKGYKPVTKVFDNGYKEVITVKLLNGKLLTLTDTHHIITKDGDVEIKDLTSSDIVYYEVDGCRFIETENQKLQYIMARSINGILKARTLLQESILNERLKTEKGNIFIGRSMKQKLGIFQMVITSTIKTGIHLTMLLIISPVWMVQNTLENILHNGMRAIKLLLKKISKESDHFQRNGIEVKRGERSILNLARFLLKKEKLTSTSASNVGNSSIQSHRTSQSIARENVRHGSTGNVQRVYDIEVAEEHEYFANGLLVHNCIDSLRYACNLLITRSRIEKRQNKFKANPIPTISRW